MIFNCDRESSWILKMESGSFLVKLQRSWSYTKRIIYLSVSTLQLHIIEGRIVIDTFSVKPQKVETNLQSIKTELLHFPLYIPTYLLISYCQQKHFQCSVRCIETLFSFKKEDCQGA